VTAPSAPASPGRVLAGLVRAGLVDATAACDGEVGLHEESRSNPVHIVEVSEVPKLAVKQPGPGPDAPALVEAEIAAYRWLAATPQIRSLAPRPTTVPEHEGWLVLEAPQGARTVHELWGTLDGTLDVVAAELGRTLASLHLAAAGGERPAALPLAQRPWVFDLPAGGSPDFAAAHEGPRRVVSELSERADLMALVEEAGNAWSARAPIHGDVKWDNVLARREPSGAWRLWLIDWELAGWGDPGWDVAGLAETIVTTQLLAGGAIDPASVGPVCRAALAAHADAIGPALETSPDQLACFAVARFAQAVVQLAAMATHREVPPVTGALLDLAGAIAVDRAAWARTFLPAGR
jgi:Ser/Thr protein kinase RdoA (MazF antagonist)